MTGRLAAFFAVLLLAGLAWWPLLGAGPLGDDLATFVDLARLGRTEVGGQGASVLAELYRVHGAEGRPLGALALAGLARLCAPDGRWSGGEILLLRLVNLALLAGAAYGLARLLRRALAPRTGVEGARAAGWAAAALLLCHPLCVPLVARPADLGVLLGLALAVLAAHAFVKGRNERRRPWLALAALLAALCGLASEFAYFLALTLGLIEFTLERRARPLALRARTTGTTLIVFAAAASVELALRAGAGVAASPPRLIEVWVDPAGGPSLASTLWVAIEKLGLLVMPVPAHGGLGTAGLVIGGAALLFALEPALVAARSAPRLWGSLLGLWLLGLLLVELSGAGLRVDPATLAEVEILFPAVVVVAAGLGTAAAAVSGVRRYLAPLAAALGYALLAQAATQAYAPAAEELAQLREDLARARERFPGARELCVLDPPERVRGLPVVGGGLENLLHPAVSGQEERVVVRGIAREAFGLWSRQVEFDSLRARGLVLVVPDAAPPRAPARDDGPAPARAGRPCLLVAAADPRPEPLLWRGEARSPLVDLDPLALRAARMGARLDATPEGPSRLHWRAREELFGQGELEGTWLRGAEGALAYFDLERSLAWLCGGRVARLWLEGQALSAEVLPELPLALEARLTSEDEDWTFELDGPEPTPAAGSELSWRLALLDLGRLVHEELEVRREGERRLRAPGAARFAARAARGGGAAAWSLELVSPRGAVLRVHGRREP